MACTDGVYSKGGARRSPCIVVAVHAKAVLLIESLIHRCEIISKGIWRKLFFVFPPLALFPLGCKWHCFLASECMKRREGDRNMRGLTVPTNRVSK